MSRHDYRYRGKPPITDLLHLGIGPLFPAVISDTPGMPNPEQIRVGAVSGSLRSPVETTPFVLVTSFLAAMAAGAVNAVAGGGTLLTVPSLLALGLDSKVANVTSTLGLWPGSLGGAWGFRRELRNSKLSMGLFLLPSLLGGLVGALLLLVTKPVTFDHLVPWLILGATVLFMSQARITHFLKRHVLRDDHDHAFSSGRWLLVLPAQFLVAVYGGYFGAGIGILMLAVLGFLGIDDLMQANGLKNMAGLVINGVAIALFLFNGLVHLPIAGAMACGALLGGYCSAGLARRMGQPVVRTVVIFVGLASAGWSAWNQMRG